MKKRVITAAIAALLIIGVFAEAGYTALRNASNSSGVEIIEIFDEAVPLSAAAASFPMPVASGINVTRSNNAEIDTSNSRDGYVMARFTTPTSASVRVIINAPNGARRQYRLNTEGRWEVFALTEGNGTYTIGVFRQIQGNRFSTAASTTINVTLSSQFAPFLRPNQFVNFNRESAVVARASELVAGSNNVIDSVGRVYNFVVNNIEYDFELARTVQSGYVPDVDAVLRRGRGICFDYAAVMAAMLRSQGIPTQLVIGYVGDVYHAWVSVFSHETGWVNNVIWFDGTTWRLMDPTFTSTGNNSPEVRAFIGTGANHRPVSRR